MLASSTARWCRRDGGELLQADDHRFAIEWPDRTSSRTALRNAGISRCCFRGLCPTAHL